MGRYVAVEGFPAAGKSELLSTLARFYPEQLVVLPELVRAVAEREGIDLFAQRKRLTEALLAAVPERQAAVEQWTGEGRLVVEDSHLGVHAAYAEVLDDAGFLEPFAELEGKLRWPELFIRLDVPISVSLRRQADRGDRAFQVGEGILSAMSHALFSWHLGRRDDVAVVDAHRAPAAALADVAGTLGLSYAYPSAQETIVPYLILLGRPASGKSELIEFLRSLPGEERSELYHLGSVVVEDDFPILWEKFVEDDDWEAVGRGRLNSRTMDHNYCVADERVWPFLIRRLNRRLGAQRSQPGKTVLVEFARGGAGAYRKALGELRSDVLARSAILYVDVPFEESRRRNRARYDQARKEGLLTHSVPEGELERSYRSDDWRELAPKSSGWVEVGGVRVPYVTVHNMPEPVGAEAYAERYRPALDELHRLWGAGA